MANSKIANKKVRNYYETTYFDYVVGIGLPWHLGIHYGYWDEGVRTTSDAIANLNRVMADKLTIISDMKILDAGCGIGGSSLWLAEKFGILGTGITLSPSQIKRAKKLAKKRGLEHRLEFEMQDYTNTNFSDETFDIVWGLESICYAEDKADFLREAFRILKPGGQLIIADGFAFRDSYGPQEHAMMRKWLDGWVVPNLAYFYDFDKLIEDCGFQNVTSQNATDNVRKFSRTLHYKARFARPFGKILEFLGIRSKLEGANIDAAIWQYRCVESGLCGYGIFTAVKPKNSRV